ncbi:MAG: phosphoribosylformylglycinamidine synthase subunit PurQ [Candidatus Hydrogenedentes bacterium]|nr:phosphoribosylformylglycinamidine synthase subunit PurQ [Candidatus Hydrogenedentota bacterium]
MSVRASVLTGFGINCDYETAHALNRAGAEASRVHLNDVIADPGMLEDVQILAVPGGFSFGDDIASGRILANRLRYKLGDPLLRFVEAGKLIIGICNGFQVLAKMGILPLFDGKLEQITTVTYNDSARFEDRWVHLAAAEGNRCIWLKGIKHLELPIRHGEGKFVPQDDEVLQELAEGGQIALRYARPDGVPARGEYPANPNASVDDIAAICDPSGRVLGIMPHPEAYVVRTNHPRWTRSNLPEEGAGLQVFRNAVAYCEEALAVS